MAAPLQLAWLWKNEEMSDVTVQLCTTQTTLQRCGRSKAARRGRGRPATAASTAPAMEALEAAARSYPCHAIVLASCSPYFKARVRQGNSSRGGGDSSSGGLKYASGTATGGSGQAASPQQGLLLLQEHVEEAELDAMEAVLRSCYTGSLCGENAGAVPLSIGMLLQMVVLSDRFDVAPILTRCCEELIRRAAADFTLSDVDCVLGGLSPSFQGHSAHGRVVAAASARLLRLLGNAEAVCNAWYSPASNLDAQLLRLTLPSLLVLLSSDKHAARTVC